MTLEDPLSPMIGVAGIAAWRGLLALTEMVTPLDPSMIAMLREGGTVALLAVVIWSYRRDWVRLADQTAAMLDYTKSAMAMLEKVSTALAVNTEVSRETKLALTDVQRTMQDISMQLITRDIRSPQSRTRNSDTHTKERV